MRLLLALLLLLAALPAAAQSPPAYRHAPDDTLRYHEVSNSEMALVLPQGTMTIETLHDGRLVLTFPARDTAHAAFEALTLRQTTPQGTQQPDLAELMGRPYTLHFPSDGRVTTIATPAFPDVLAGVTDLSWEFWDFFLPLPTTPLAPGVTWTDSLRTARDEAHVSTRHSRYEVTGDTLVDGRHAWIVREDVTHSVTLSAPGPQGLTIHTTLRGDSQGTFLFDAARGRMLHRTRAGETMGTLRYEGGPQPFEVPQRMTYDGFISLLEDR